MQIQRKIKYFILLIAISLLGSFVINFSSQKASSFEQACKNNLDHAEHFLAELSTNPNIQTIVPGKLYQEILETGTDITTPLQLFHYVIKTADNTIIADTYKDQTPKIIHPNNAIIGLSKGIQNIKVGEKRKLYVHPDFAYRKISIFTPPQALLIIEIEAINDIDVLKNEAATIKKRSF